MLIFYSLFYLMHRAIWKAKRNILHIILYLGIRALLYNLELHIRDLPNFCFALFFLLTQVVRQTGLLVWRHRIDS